MGSRRHGSVALAMSPSSSYGWPCVISLLFATQTTPNGLTDDASFTLFQKATLPISNPHRASILLQQIKYIPFDS